MEMKTNRWLYVIIGVLIMLLNGFVYAWSVMAKPIGASRLDWTAASLSLTFTLIMFFFCIGCLIAGFVGNKISPKIYVMAGSVLFFVGFLCASLTGESIGLLYLGFGVFAGFGAGMIYNVVMSSLSAWFPDKQGMISGIMMMGFGISSFIIGKVFAAVTPTDGSDTWKMTFRVMAIVIFAVLFVCAFIIKRPTSTFQPSNVMNKVQKREPAIEVGPGKMMKMPVFWFYYIWAAVIGAAGLAIVSQGGAIASEVGPLVSDGNIATVVGLLSLFNGVGRVIFGSLYDKRGHRFTMLLDMVIFFVAVILILLALVTNVFMLIVVGFVVCGIAYGGVTPLGSALMSDFFGRMNYSKNFSVVTTTLMISSVASTIAGRLYDISGSYCPTIYMALGLLVVCFVISFTIRRPQA